MNISKAEIIFLDLDDLITSGNYSYSKNWLNIGKMILKNW